MEGTAQEFIVNKTIEKYEKYINPSIAELFLYMGLSTVEWTELGSTVCDVAGG